MDRTAVFHLLHRQDRLFHLPTVWDAASARLAVQAGAPAVGTSSAALSWAHGHADGGHMPPDDVLRAVARIGRGLEVPLTVDIEAGLDDDPARVAAFVEALRAAGAAGINLEDGTAPPGLLCEKIRAIRGRPACRTLFVNARTDVLLRGFAVGEDAVDAVLDRAGMYDAAGADGLFVPGLASCRHAARISRGTGLVLNLMTVPGLPSAEALSAAGVRRLSTGPAPFVAAYGQAARFYADFLAPGAAAPHVDYDAMNACFAAPVAAPQPVDAHAVA